MRKFVHAKPGQKTAAQVSGPTKLSPELIALFNGVVERVEAEVGPVPVREPAPQPMRKNRKHNLKAGMMYGYLVLRRKLPPRKDVKPSLRERWKVECLAPECNRQIDVPKYYLIRPGNPKTHCGCQFQTLKSTHSREYRIWHMMHQRCLNPNHTSFKHYQKMGITIHEDFLKTNPEGFDNWLADVGPCPSPNHSLDRIRNAVGYMPGNLRWSTSSEQRLNQGDLIGGKSSEEISELGMTEDEWVEHVKKHGY